MTYRIVLRNGWYVPQERVGETWTDFVSLDPGEPWIGFRTLPEARTIGAAGPVRGTPDVFVEDG